jgi:NodT family efflux transporter outer membrane factor (OMF) lipoprotein
MNRKQNLLAWLMVLLTLSGCRVGPNVCLPCVETAGDWHAEAAVETEQTVFTHCNPLELGELFDDPLLIHYLRCLSSQNHDVRLAAAKVREALALRRMSAAKLLPFVDARIAYNTSKPAGGILDSTDPLNQGGGVLGGIPLNLKQQTFIADFDALWEIDLFGKRQNEVESATAFIRMEAASYDAVLVSLLAEFTRTYLELRRAQISRELIEREIQIVKEKIEVVESRLTSGLDTELLVLDSQADLDQLASAIPSLEAEILSLMYRLSVLLGKTPDALTAQLSESRVIPDVPPTVPIGFPSELLRRRPDIFKAEQGIVKATADVGASVADLFPKLTLTGNYGFQNLHLGNMKGSGESWGIGGGLLTPLFHGGSIKANISRNRWILQEAFIIYEQTVLQALEESESAIARYAKSREAVQSRKNAYDRNRELLGHTQDLYDNGLANRVRLEESKLNEIKAEREWINEEIDSQIHLVALYKALGGSFCDN